MTMQDSTKSHNDLLSQEQEAFDTALATLLPDHKGEFVVFKDQKPIGFFRTAGEAYSNAIRKFGLDSSFLISEVNVQRPCSASLSWDLAVL